MGHGRRRLEADNIVWGTSGEVDNIVWGTSSESDNVTWGCSGEETPLFDDPDVPTEFDGIDFDALLGDAGEPVAGAPLPPVDSAAAAARSGCTATRRCRRLTRRPTSAGLAEGASNGQASFATRRR